MTPFSLVGPCHKYWHSSWGQSMTRTNILSGPHMALAMSGGVPSNDTFTLAIEILAPENKAYSEFNYTRGQGVDYVSGPDNSAKQAALRFSETDDIAVYVNGVKRDQSTYDRTINNRIKFASVLTEDYNTVKVVVFSKPKPERKMLTFKKVYDYCGIDSAWQNVTLIEKYDGGPEANHYSVFFADDFSDIRQNATFVVAQDQQVDNPSPVSPDSWFFLLSTEPHTPFDRDVDFIVDITKAIEAKVQFVYELDNKGSLAFTVSDENVQTVFPRLRVLDRCRKDERGDEVSDSPLPRNTAIIN